MAMFYDAALAILVSDPLTSALLVGAGFLLCHLIHAVRYSFLGGFSGGSNFFDRTKKFFKLLLFLKM